MNKKELQERLITAKRKYLKVLGAVSEDYAAFELGVNLNIEQFKVTIRKGIYFHQTNDENDTVYSLAVVQLNGRTLGDILEEAGEQPTKEQPIKLDIDHTEGVELTVEYEPVMLQEGIPLTFSTLIAWLAVAEADTKETAQEIIDGVFLPPQEQEAASAPGRELQKIAAAPVDKSDIPLDKVNSQFWDLLEIAKDGQLGFDFREVEESGKILAKANVAKHGSGAEIPIIYGVDFSELEGTITKKLEPYDKRVCQAVAASYNAGNSIMTLQMIYEAMGYTGNMGAANRAKINDSLTKMSKAELVLDNSEEHRLYNREHFKYEGKIIQMERVSAIQNGQVVDAAIRVFREPVLISFAKARKQFTTVPVKLLDTGLSKTAENIRIEDYLIDRIAHMKQKEYARSKSKAPEKIPNPKKILYETIYEHARIKASKQKQRAPKKIERALDWFTKCGYIKGYTMEKDGVRIEL